MSNLGTARAALLFVLLLLSTSAAAFAQGSLHLSRNADFSTDDAIFQYGDSLFILVEAPDINYTDLDENEIRIKSNLGFEYRSDLTNNLDGTYTGAIYLAANATNSVLEELFYVEVKLGDGQGNEFRGDGRFAIGTQIAPVEVEIRGAIQEIGDTYLVVLSRKIFVTDDTRILDTNENEIPFSDLGVGDHVRVRFHLSFSGELIAHRIDLRNADAFEIKVTGEIEDIGDDYVTVLGRRFLVSIGTKIKDKNGTPIRFADLKKGDLVEIEAELFASGVLFAKCIQRKDRPSGIVEFRGVIDELFDRGIVVLGRKVAVNADTRILSNEGDVLEFGDLAPGQAVRIAALVLADNTLLAKKIVVLKDSHVVVRGEIREIGDRVIVVGDAKFFVTEDTEIQTEDGHDVSFGRLIPGLSVIVEAGLNADGSFVATKITIVRPSVAYRTITGRVTAIGDAAFGLNGNRIHVTRFTRFVDEDGNAVEFADLSVGQRVRVLVVSFVGYTDEAPTYYAVRVKFLEERQKRIVGYIDRLSSNALVVAGVEAAIVDDTEILDKNGEPIGVEDLEQDILVAMWIRQDGAGGFVATKIRVLPRIEDEIGVAGVVESLGDSSLVVLGQTFHLLENSVVRNADGTVITLDALRVGQSVALRGELMAGGELIALHIQALSSGVNNIKVLGPVEEVGANTITVLGIYFFVDNTTKIFDLARNEVDLSMLEPGQTVLLGAIGQPDGTRLAKRIEVQDVILSSGSIAIAGDGVIQVLGANYHVMADALVIGEDGKILDSSALKDSMYCEIRGTTAEDGTVQVSKVKIFESAGSVSVDDPAADLPKSVTLQSNYPNPFNPTTTIEFELTAAADGQVTTLSVYDTMGRLVRTLESAPLSAGVHVYTWDSRDANGNVVASGTYFYKVQVGSFVETKAMTLLK